MDKWKKDLSKGFKRHLPKQNEHKEAYSENQTGEQSKIKYFKDEKKEILDEHLLDGKAKNLAKSIEYLASSQMRKFYDEIKNLQIRLDSATDQGRDREQEFLKLRPILKMLKSKVSYAKNRLGNKMPDKFVDFIHHNVDSIADSKDFEAFALFFEAVVGYKGGK